MKRGHRLLLFLLAFLSFSYLILAQFPGSLTITSPFMFQNITGSTSIDITIADLDDNSNVTNVTFEFNNGSGVWQVIDYNTTENLTAYSLAWDTTVAGLGDGTNISINITAIYVNQTNQTAPDQSEDYTYNSTTVENLTVDNTPPTVTANEPTDNSITNLTEITFNITVVDLIFTTIANCSLTLDPTNSSDGASINSTTDIANGTDVIFINTVPTGGHTWNVACVDSLDINNTGYSDNLTFNGGTTAGSVSLDLLDAARASKTTFGATDNIIFACTRSDEDGINETIVSVQFPGDNTQSIIDDTVHPVAINASETIEVTFSQTARLGDYLALCKVVDVAGNTNSTNLSFTIVKKLSKGGLPKGSQKPIGNKIVSGTEDLGTVSEEGVSRLVRKGASLQVDVKGEMHTIAVKDLSPAAVTLTITSTPQDVTINKGETKEVDVDDDGQNDFAITFHQQFKSGASATADITVKAVSTPAEPKRDVGKQPTTTEDQAKGSFAGSAIVTVLVIIAVIVIGFALIRGKKK